ncbi:Metallo-hydrolase/oxidoreductase [Corynespora cassiicola Philippines]|uniref:Metallo-hydrolase/oxidoreductase n=1 Tax=Corynespora cassiicola Philippines TaxID=1448308 RepID=A0A2T2N2E6_CORCC|nr:Metallo-hydrolase/oxidoreductase [Corynespora cassiicola Philippines]
MGSKLQVDIYVAPPILANTGLDGDLKNIWSPISCTLIHGPSSAALIDTPINVEQNEALAKWIAETIPKKQLKYIYTTHAHPDHFIGVPILEKAFPGVQFIATRNVADGIIAQYDFYDAMWPALFPNQLPEGKPVPKPLPESNEFFIDGEKLQGIDVGHADNQYSSFLHVPSLHLVAAGDIVYGDCHQHFGEAKTPEKRKEWLNAIDQIEALKPQIVVAGHKRATQADGPYLMQSTREYIYTFEKELAKASSSSALCDRMVELYPQRWNLFIIDFSSKQSFAAKEQRL